MPPPMLCWKNLEPLQPQMFKAQQIAITADNTFITIQVQTQIFIQVAQTKILLCSMNLPMLSNLNSRFLTKNILKQTQKYQLSNQIYLRLSKRLVKKTVSKILLNLWTETPLIFILPITIMRIQEEFFTLREFFLQAIFPVKMEEIFLWNKFMKKE